MKFTLITQLLQQIQTKEYETKLSLNGNAVISSVINIDTISTNIEFIYDGAKTIVNALSLNPIQFRDVNMLNPTKYLEFQDSREKKCSNSMSIDFGKDSAEQKTKFIINKINTISSTNKNCQILEYQHQNPSKSLKNIINYIIFCFDNRQDYLPAKKDIESIIASRWNSDISIVDDVNVHDDCYTQDALIKVDETVFTSTSLRFITTEGKISIEDSNNKNKVIVSDMKGDMCKDVYQNDPIEDKTINNDPQCCISWENNNKSTNQLCATNEKTCVQDIFAILKKLKLFCSDIDLVALRRIDNNHIPNFIMIPNGDITGIKQIDHKKIIKVDPAKLLSTKVQPTILDYSEDKIQFYALTQSQLDAQDSKPSENKLNPEQLLVDKITFQERNFSIKFLNNDKIYKRNQQHIKIYQNEDFTGFIQDSQDQYEQYKQIFKSEVAPLERFKAVMLRILGTPPVYSNGQMCDLMEFEHPISLNQELMFMCQCPLCPPVAWSRQLFHSEIYKQMQLSYQSGNIGLNTKIQKNDFKYKGRYLSDKHNYSDKSFIIELNNDGIIINDTEIIKYNEIKDDEEHKCQLYYNSNESIAKLGKFNNKFTQRQCCIRYLTGEAEDFINYLCLDGRQCSIMRQSIIKKIKTQCQYAKEGINIENKESNNRFITSNNSVSLANKNQIDFNQESGLQFSNNPHQRSILVKMQDLTSNNELILEERVMIITRDKVKFEQLNESSEFETSLADLQLLCTNNLFCDDSNIKEAGLKNKLMNIQDKVKDSSTDCKLLYFFNKIELKRNIIQLCPVNPDAKTQFPDIFRHFYKQFLSIIHENPSAIIYHFAYALNTYPFEVSILGDTPSIISFKPNGILKDEDLIIDYATHSCSIVIHLADKPCCIKMYTEEREPILICIGDKSDIEYCEFKSLMLAKKVAIDCSRFKNKQNDVISITNENEELASYLQVAKESLQELDGNKAEAVSLNPGDHYLTPLIQNEFNEVKPTQIQDEDKKEVVFDEENGIFTGPATFMIAGEAQSIAKQNIELGINPSNITFGSEYEIETSELTWPCHSEQYPCAINDFKDSRALPVSQLSSKMIEIKSFLDSNQISEDQTKLCSVVGIQPKKLAVVCAANEEQFKKFNKAFIIAQKMAIENLDLDKKEITKFPFEDYQFNAKIHIDNQVEDKILRVTQDGIKNKDNVLVQWDKIENNCEFKWRFTAVPTSFSKVDTKCCTKFNYENLDSPIYICLTDKFRCMAQLKWFLPNSYFFCKNSNNDLSTMEKEDYDPSIFIINKSSKDVKTDVEKSMFSNPIQNVSETELIKNRDSDQAFFNFRQRYLHRFNQQPSDDKTTPNLSVKQPSPSRVELTSAKCMQTDQKEFHQFANAYWRVENGETVLEDDLYYVRVLNDSICVCNKCYEGFRQSEQDTKGCLCHNMSDMIFKCSLQYEICTQEEFKQQLGNYKQQTRLASQIDKAISNSKSNIENSDCIFLQFQIMYRFDELVVCLGGVDSAKQLYLLKSMLNSRQPFQAGNSHVHFNRPILPDLAKSNLMVFNKTTATVDQSGSAMFDSDALVASQEDHTLNQALVKQSDIEKCDIKYKNIPFPDLTHFMHIPQSSCCFEFVSKGSELFVCHLDQQACIVPSRRIMYKLRSKCKINRGMLIKDQFNFAVSRFEAGFWRGYGYLVDSSNFVDPAVVPSMVIKPSYLEIDRKRNVRIIKDPSGLWSDEEIQSQSSPKLEKQVSAVYQFKYLEFKAKTYLPLSPDEQMTLLNRQISDLEDENMLVVYQEKLNRIRTMLKKLQTATSVENCFVLEQRKQSEAEKDATLLIMCPILNSAESSRMLKWAFALSQNYNRVNSIDRNFRTYPFQKSIKLQLYDEINKEGRDVLLSMQETDTSLKVTNIESSKVEELFLLESIKDKNRQNFCSIETKSFTLPTPIKVKGFTELCCIQIKTKEGMQQMCNQLNPRCYIEIRQISRMIRKVCLILKYKRQDMDIGYNLFMQGQEEYESKDRVMYQQNYKYYLDKQSKTQEKFTSVVAILNLSSVKTSDFVYNLIIEADSVTNYTKVQIKSMDMTEEIETFNIIDLHFQCTKIKLSCSIDEQLELMVNILSEKAQIELNQRIKSFKNTVRSNDSFDPKTFEGMFILQNQDKLLSTMDTQLIALADPFKYQEVKEQIYQKYLTESIGQVRTNIVKDRNVPMLTNNDQVEVAFLKTDKNLVVNGSNFYNIQVRSSYIRSKDGGRKLIEFENVLDTNEFCLIDQFADVNLPSDQDFINTSCCIRVKLMKATEYICLINTNRCESQVNTLLKTFLDKCNKQKNHTQRRIEQTNLNPEIIDEKFGIRQSQALLGGYFKPYLQTPYEEMEGDKQSSLNVIIDMNMNEQSNSYQMGLVEADDDYLFLSYSEKDPNNLRRLIKHRLEHFNFIFNEFKNAEEQITLMKIDQNNLFEKEQIIQFERKVEMALASITRKKLQTDPISKEDCLVIDIEHVGSQISFQQVVCGPYLPRLKAELTKTLKNKVMETLEEPTSLKKKFNEFQLVNQPIMLKFKSVMRLARFDKLGMQVDDEGNRIQFLKFKQISRGWNQEMCPVWQNYIEKQLLVRNSTINSECCLKTIQNNRIVAICLSEEQGDNCLHTKMKLVVTFKNLCHNYTTNIHTEKIKDILPDKFEFNILKGEQKGVAQISYLNNIKKFDSTEAREITVTSENFSFIQDDESVKKSIDLTVTNSAIQDQGSLNLILSDDQINNVTALITQLINDINISREKTLPRLTILDCHLLRHMAEGLNFENQLICHKHPDQSEIFLKAYRNASELKMINIKNMANLPQTIPDFKYNLLALEGNNSATVFINSEYELVNIDTQKPILAFQELMNLHKKCPMWFNVIQTPEGMNSNCCISFERANRPFTLCESSAQYCSYNIRMLLREIISQCDYSMYERMNKHKNLAIDASIPFYSNEKTLNFGWEPYLVPKKPPTPIVEEKTPEEEANSDPSTPKDKPEDGQDPLTFEDDKTNGQIKLSAYFFNLDTLSAPQRFKDRILLTIHDNSFTISRDAHSKPVESAQLSQLIISGESIDLVKSPNESALTDEQRKILANELEQIDIQVKGCILFRFNNSKLSMIKQNVRETKDATINNVICPSKAEWIGPIKQATRQAFNRAMQALEPSNDLPEIPENKSFSVDIFLGNENYSNTEILFGGQVAVFKIEGEEVEIHQEDILYCKITTFLSNSELPKKFIRDVDSGLQESNEVQTDCCIYFKYFSFEVQNGNKLKVLKNTQICSNNSVNCTYDALMVTKELSEGCEEVIEANKNKENKPAKQIDGVRLATDPEHLREPIDQKWVEGEGWVYIGEKESDVVDMAFNHMSFTDRFKSKDCDVWQLQDMKDQLKYGNNDIC